jgi:hypothetical protein
MEPGHSGTDSAVDHLDRHGLQTDIVEQPRI